MNQDEIREMVSKAYSEALKKARDGGGACCAPAAEATGSCAPTPAGEAARTAGYGAELAKHAEAGASSFGCGNPLAFADVKPGETVLDLGSGAGFDLLIAADKVGPEGRVIGIDMTDDMIAEARRNAERAGHANVEVRKGLIEELPVEDASVDWVISNCVVNLSPEKERVFAEIHRVLKPGGRFSVYDMVVEDLPQGVREHAAAYAACVAGAISEGEYVGGLLEAGLEDVQIAECQVYEVDQIRGIVANDLGWAGLDPASLESELDSLEGKVASVRITGQRP